MQEINFHLLASIVYLRLLILPFTWLQVIWQDNVDPDNMTYEVCYLSSDHFT